MTVTEERVGPTREELLRRARDLVPLLREHAPRAERERRLTNEVTDALREAGMFTLAAPPPGAGAAADVATLVEVTAELARGDGSAGWVALLFNTGAYLTGLLPDRARAEVYGPDPLATVCGQLTPSAAARSVAEGYVVSGRWAWASGSPQARWSMVTIPLLDGDGELVDLRAALVPVDELTLEDTWFAAGMAATASNTFVAEEVFVPEHRTLSLPAMYAGATRNEHPEEVLYRSTTHSALTLAIAGPMIGLARAAFEHVIAAVRRGKPIAYSSYARSSDAPSYQLALADAAALIDTAVLHARRSADAIDAAARADVQLDGLSRARVRSDMATVNVALSREIYGRALLGIGPQVTPMV